MPLALQKAAILADSGPVAVSGEGVSFSFYRLSVDLGMVDVFGYSADLSVSFPLALRLGCRLGFFFVNGASAGGEKNSKLYMSANVGTRDDVTVVGTAIEKIFITAPYLVGVVAIDGGDVKLYKIGADALGESVAIVGQRVLFIIPYHTGTIAVEGSGALTAKEGSVDVTVPEAGLVRTYKRSLP